MIIDAHQHFWDLDTGTYDWMSGDDMAPLRRNFGPHELKPLLAATGVDKTILVQCRHDLAETRAFLEIAARNDFVAGVVGWADLQAADVAAQIDALRALPGGNRLVGIRHIVHDEPDADWLQRPAVRGGISAVIASGLAYDLLVRARELPSAIELVGEFPAGRFVLDHMAKPPIASDQTGEWRKQFEAMAEFKNVWCKISGLVTEADWDGWRPRDFDPYLRLALDLFGPDRIIFGSDWPVSTLAASYGEVKAIANRLSETNPGITERFFGRNAIAAYNLNTRKMDRLR